MSGDSVAEWPRGGGDMGGRIRAFDWSETALGAILAWPQSLKTTLDLILPSGFPMIALLGADLVQIYNDAYRDVMGDKHPGGLGQPTRACWPEVWHINAPIYDRVWAGETLTFRDGLYPLVRHGAPEHVWFDLTYSPLRDEAGAIVGVLVTLMETTGRVRAEAALRRALARQSELLHELQHRVRNTLGMVRAIVRRTIENADTPEAAGENLEGRISALARVQSLLTRAVGVGVDLQTLVREELLAQAADETRILVDGPDVVLSPKAAEVLTLAVHELAANATRFGALGRYGELTVRWRVHPTPGGPDWLRFEWTESGVTVMAGAPRTKGFGAEVIERRAPYELKGEGRITFRPGGLSAEIAFPLIPGASILSAGDILAAPEDDLEGDAP